MELLSNKIRIKERNHISNKEDTDIQKSYLGVIDKNNHFKVISGGIAMRRIAQFFKVSREQFVGAMREEFPDYSPEEIDKIYDALILPCRATKGSAGYDFFAPFSFTLPAGATIKIPTGIRVKMEEDWVLKVYPRSGLGFKYRLQMNNTVGIIDSDYYFSDNEGHIFIKMTNASTEGKTVEVSAGSGFAQGIFLEYGITVDDAAEGIRNGGFGSTTTK